MNRVQGVAEQAAVDGRPAGADQGHAETRLASTSPPSKIAKTGIRKVTSERLVAPAHARIRK